VLPKVYARGNLDPVNLGGLVDLIGNIAIHDAKTRSADVLGHVFEYFLGEFALAEGKKGGQFYTPRSVVELLVDMLEPHTGRVFDPCCGSGGMFVQSEKFVAEHQGKVNDIVIYGQESNLTTWRLCKANGRFRNRTNEILFIDARNEGHLINRRTLEFSADDIKKIAGIYHKWRNPKGRYEDIKGFCNSAGIQRVRELDYVLTPGRYVGLPEEKDDFDFKERFTALKAEFEEQLKEEAILNKKILANLARIDLDGGKRRAGEK
jgi:type I restriction-modification system DNA methylase subunit